MIAGGFRHLDRLLTDLLFRDRVGLDVVRRTRLHHPPGWSHAIHLRRRRSAQTRVAAIRDTRDREIEVAPLQVIATDGLVHPIKVEVSGTAATLKRSRNSAEAATAPASALSTVRHDAAFSEHSDPDVALARQKMDKEIEDGRKIGATVGAVFGFISGCGIGILVGNVLLPAAGTVLCLPLAPLGAATGGALAEPLGGTLAESRYNDAVAKARKKNARSGQKESSAFVESRS